MAANQEQVRGRFSRRLTQNEVEQRLILFSFAEVAMVFEFQDGESFFMEVKDNLGKDWTFQGKFHSHVQVGNYISISYPQFSLERGLKANDEITFTERPLRDGIGPWKKFNVEIRRRIRLFGQDIWGEINF